jgi:hypothetical protein
MLFTVYRGQGLSKNELLSFSNFLSTTKDWKVSFLYAETVANSETAGIFFEFIVDHLISTILFALVNKFRQFKGEAQILFS